MGPIKKVALELGGKNALTVCRDTDMELAADAVVHGFLFNAGQCCQSSSPVLVHEDVLHAFSNLVAERAARAPFGEPLNALVKVGAVVNEFRINEIDQYVGRAREEDRAFLTGGERQDGSKGLCCKPMVNSPTGAEHRESHDEIFGPVVSMIPFSGLDEAIGAINSTRYGHSGGAWTADADAEFCAIKKIRAGSVRVDAWMDGFPEVPFGEFSESGLGREGESFAVEEYREQMSVLVQHGKRSETSPISGAACWHALLGNPKCQYQRGAASRIVRKGNGRDRQDSECLA